MQNGRGEDRGHADGRAGARRHGAVSVGLRGLLLRGDKGIAAAGSERGDVHLLRPMPRVPAEHLANELRDRGGAGRAGQAGVKPGQHRRSGAGLPIQEEQPGGGRQMGGIPVQASAEVVCHDDLLTRRDAGRAACGRQHHHRAAARRRSAPRLQTPRAGAGRSPAVEGLGLCVVCTLSLYRSATPAVTDDPHAGQGAPSHVSRHLRRAAYPHTELSDIISEHCVATGR